MTLGVRNVATLHLMVGLPCSGKTTLAQKLEHELPGLRLTLDEWHIRLFGQDAEEPEHDARHSLIEAILWNIASSAVHYLDVPEDELLRRLEKRNSRPSQESFLISEEAMKPWIAFFQKPTLDELERRE